MIKTNLLLVQCIKEKYKRVSIGDLVGGVTNNWILLLKKDHRDIYKIRLSLSRKSYCLTRSLLFHQPYFFIPQPLYSFLRRKLKKIIAVRTSPGQLANKFQLTVPSPAYVSHGGQPGRRYYRSSIHMAPSASRDVPVDGQTPPRCEPHQILYGPPFLLSNPLLLELVRGYSAK